MKIFRLLTVTAMVAAALVLAPPANAQTTPVVTVTAGPAITEGEDIRFFVAFSEPPGQNINLHYDLEETERVGESVNSNFVNDDFEGLRTARVHSQDRQWSLVFGTQADGVHEDSEAKNGRTHTVTFTLLTQADGVHEDSEAKNGRTNTVTFTLLEGSGYTVGDPSSATVEVADDEAAWGTVEWEDTSVTVAEEDGYVEFDVTLSKPYSYPLTLSTLFAPRTEALLTTPGDDYDVDSANTEITIPALTQRVPLRVGLVDDDEPEDDEHFLMLLEVPPGLPVIKGDVITGLTITDGDEEPPVESCAAWCVVWSATTLAEGESVTMSIRDPDGTVDDSKQIAVTLHVGRTESTADIDDVEVKDEMQPGELLPAYTFSPNMHHRGAWVYIHGFFPYGEAKTRTMVVEALDNIDGADSETLATWVYVNGALAGSQLLTITNSPQTQR